MSFEDVDRKVREALSKLNIVFRTAEEENLANFTMLLTENAQKEALEYNDAHYKKAAMVHESYIKEGRGAYTEGAYRSYIREGYERDGIEGIVQALKDNGNQPAGTSGFSGSRSSDDVLRLQEQVVEHVKSNNLAGQILHGPSLADIKNAMHAEEVQAATESVSMARRTLQNIIEGSELAAKVMRFRV